MRLALAKPVDMEVLLEVSLEAFPAAIATEVRVARARVNFIGESIV
jgi:hypothetical protein